MEMTRRQKRELKELGKMFKMAREFEEKEALKTRVNLEDYYNENKENFVTITTRKGDTLVWLKDAIIKTQYNVKYLKHYMINVNDINDIRHK